MPCFVLTWEELRKTVNCATSMVKEREDAIADLLRENELLKTTLDQIKNTPDKDNQDVELLHSLNDEVATAKKGLTKAEQETTELTEEFKIQIVALKQQLSTKTQQLETADAETDKIRTMLQNAAQAAATATLSWVQALEELDQLKCTSASSSSFYHPQHMMVSLRNIMPWVHEKKRTLVFHS
jgi:chromosome segregation ATPase